MRAGGAALTDRPAPSRHGHLFARHQLDPAVALHDTVGLDNAGLIHHAPGHGHLTAVGEEGPQVQGFTYRGRHLGEKAFPVRAIGKKGRASRSQGHMAVRAGDDAGRRILHVRGKEIDAFDARIDRAGVLDDAVRSAVLEEVQPVQKIGVTEVERRGGEHAADVDLPARPDENPVGIKQNERPRRVQRSVDLRRRPEHAGEHPASDRLRDVDDVIRRDIEIARVHDGPGRRLRDFGHDSAVGSRNRRLHRYSAVNDFRDRDGGLHRQGQVRGQYPDQPDRCLAAYGIHPAHGPIHPHRDSPRLA